MNSSAAPDDLPNLGLLIKLLKMTTSNTDAEALSAMRKANQQLQKFGGDWEALLRGKVTVIGDPFLDMPSPPKREANMARPAAPRRPAPPPPPARPSVQPKPQPSYSRQRAAAPPPKAQPFRPGPSGGKTRSNLYAGSCLRCSNHVAVDDGFSLKDTSWNTTGKWQVCCHSCFYRNAPAGYAPAKATVTNIDLDSLA